MLNRGIQHTLILGNTHSIWQGLLAQPAYLKMGVSHWPKHYDNYLTKIVISEERKRTGEKKCWLLLGFRLTRGKNPPIE